MPFLSVVVSPLTTMFFLIDGQVEKMGRKALLPHPKSSAVCIAGLFLFLQSGLSGAGNYEIC